MKRLLILIPMLHSESIQANTAKQLTNIVEIVKKLNSLSKPVRRHVQFEGFDPQQTVKLNPRSLPATPTYTSFNNPFATTMVQPNKAKTHFLQSSDDDTDEKTQRKIRLYKDGITENDIKNEFIKTAYEIKLTKDAKKNYRDNIEFYKKHIDYREIEQFIEDLIDEKIINFELTPNWIEKIKEIYNNLYPSNKQRGSSHLPIHYGRNNKKTGASSFQHPNYSL